MLIYGMIKKEAQRNENMIAQYEQLIKELPKGSLICRKKDYYYLKYREGGKVFDEYIGKDPEAVDQVREKLELRKHYMEMLSVLKKEKKAIQKIMEGIT